MKRALALLLLLIPATALAQVEVQLVSPKAGAVLRAGEQVLLQWKILAPRDLPACEQELMLSINGGRTNTLRVTPMMSPNLRQFLWTVPNVNSRNAVLDVRYGCEGTVIEPPTYIPQHPQRASKFTIVGSSSPAFESIALEPLAASEIGAGESATLSWRSSVNRVDVYEVMISYDRGNHFHSLGTTPGTSFEWSAPRSLFGGATFQVIAHRVDGSTVSSPIPAREQLTVRPRD